MKRFARKIMKSIKPLYLIPVAVIAVLIVVGVVLVGGGEDEKKEADAALGIGEGEQIPGQRARKVKQAPRVRTGIVDEARRVGRLAVAQARGTVVDPARVRIRVSAAPKQVVTVNWQLGCYKERRSAVGRDSYRTRSPDVRGITLPTQGAKTCIATASAQLTRMREGRIKVAIIAG